MEIVYNMRDSNLDRSFEWNCVKLTATQVGVSVPSNDAQETIQTSSYDCMSWAYLQGDKSYLVSYDLQHHYQITELWSSDGRLYYDDSGILTHQQTPSPLYFAGLFVLIILLVIMRTIAVEIFCTILRVPYGTSQALLAVRSHYRV